MGHTDDLHHKLKRYCLSLTADPWDADDLAQETWTKAFHVQDHANPMALLMRIARTTWIDHTRKQKLQNRYMETERANARLPEHRNEPDTMELETIFQSLFRYLTPLQRTAFLLKEVYRFQASEIAHLLRTTEGAVKAALHRARRSLRNVRRDLERGGPPEAKQEEYKTLLRCLVSAFRNDDLAALVEIALRNDVEPAVALAAVHNRNRRQRERLPISPMAMANGMRNAAA